MIKEQAEPEPELTEEEYCVRSMARWGMPARVMRQIYPDRFKQEQAE